MKGSCSKWVTVPLGGMWQILNILVSLADLRANPSFPSSAVPALIFWWFIPHYGASFVFFFPSFFPKLTGVPWICLICQESLLSPAGDFPLRSSCPGHGAPGPSIPSAGLGSCCSRSTALPGLGWLPRAQGSCTTSWKCHCSCHKMDFAVGLWLKAGIHPKFSKKISAWQQ